MNKRHVKQLMKTINSPIGFLCALGIMAQTTAVALAENAIPDKESTDYINLLKNGGFEAVKEGETNYPADWRYYGSCVPGSWELTKPGHEGKQCVRLWSDEPGWHGGVIQNFRFESNRRYKMSSWIKSRLSEGGELTLLAVNMTYIFIQDGQKTNKLWFADAGVKKGSFDWQYIEKTFETPTNAAETLNGEAYLVQFGGQGEVWVDDARLADMGPVKLGKELYSMPFDDPKLWKVSAHVNEAPMELPEGVSIQKDGKHECEGKPGLKLNYRFMSPKHDAILLTSAVSIPGGSLLALRVYGDGSGHELDAVLFDKNGEAHYLPIGTVCWHGWNTVYKSFGGLCLGPANKRHVSCKHWGGDNNQTLEFPITRITVGLNDQPDEFKGKGEITFGWLKVYE